MDEQISVKSHNRRFPGVLWDSFSALMDDTIPGRVVPRGGYLLRQDDRSRAAHILLEGWTYHAVTLPDGRRQITAIQVPGDVCDLAAAMRGRAPYDVIAATDCVVGEIPSACIQGRTAFDVGVGGLLWRRLLREDAIAREWMVGLGRRDALERVAHLLCELRVRLDEVGLAPGGATFRLVFNQSDLADATGLSAVHTNRVLQSLRGSGLIRTARRFLTVIDIPVLEMVAGFDPAYLDPV